MTASPLPLYQGSRGPSAGRIPTPAAGAGRRAQPAVEHCSRAAAERVSVWQGHRAGLGSGVLAAWSLRQPGAGPTPSEVRSCRSHGFRSPPGFQFLPLSFSLSCSLCFLTTCIAGQR